MEYIAYLHKDRDSDYGVSFPDFPGCITAGKTLEEASRMAAEALTLHIRGMIEDGDNIPEPSKLDGIAKDATRRHAIAFMVRADAPDATVRVNITARESQIAKIDALAEAAGMTRSGYIVRAITDSDYAVERLVKQGGFLLQVFHECYTKDQTGRQTEFWRGKITGWKQTLVTCYGVSAAERIIVRASASANLPVPHSGTLAPDGSGYEGFDSLSHMSI